MYYSLNFLRSSKDDVQLVQIGIESTLLNILSAVYLLNYQTKKHNCDLLFIPILLNKQKSAFKLAVCKVGVLTYFHLSEQNMSFV